MNGRGVGGANSSFTRVEPPEPQKNQIYQTGISGVMRGKGPSASMVVITNIGIVALSQDWFFAQAQKNLPDAVKKDPNKDRGTFDRPLIARKDF